MSKYSLLAGDANQVSIIFLYITKMSKQQRFIFKLSISYGGNVNYCKSGHHLLSTLPVEIGNKLNGRGRTFFRECKKVDRIMKLPTRARGCYEKRKFSLLL